MAKRVLPFVLCLCVTGTANAETITQKEALRREAIQVEERFQRNEITEAAAIEQLDAIEKTARELKKNPNPMPMAIPKGNPREPSKAEQAIGTVLMRQAALPRLSLWEYVIPFFRPFVFGLIILVLCVICIIGFFAVGTIIDKISDRLRSNRSTTTAYPGRRTPAPRATMVAQSPMRPIPLPRAYSELYPGRPTTPPPATTRSIPRTPYHHPVNQSLTGLLPSGEVPDSYT
jgi:hypothetical protein